MGFVDLVDCGVFSVVPAKPGGADCFVRSLEAFMALALAETASRLTLNAHVVQPMDMFALSSPNSNPCPQWHHTAAWRWSTAS